MTPPTVPAARPARTSRPGAIRSASAASALKARRAAPGEFEPSYVTRKRLTPHELLAAVGVGLGIGLAAFYVAKVWIERSDVLPSEPAPRPEDSDKPVSPVNRTVTPQRAAP